MILTREMPIGVFLIGGLCAYGLWWASFVAFDRGHDLTGTALLLLGFAAWVGGGLYAAGWRMEW